MQSAVLAVSRAQPFHGETGRTRSFTIELRGAHEAGGLHPPYVVVALDPAPEQQA
jgi:hypothetical protein